MVHRYLHYSESDSKGYDLVLDACKIEGNQRKQGHMYTRNQVLLELFVWGEESARIVTSIVTWTRRHVDLGLAHLISRLEM